MKGGSITRHILICLLVLSHLASSAVGGSLLVRCQGTDGHDAIEVSHPAACYGHLDTHVHRSLDHPHCVQQPNEHCKDDPIATPLLIRKHDSHHDTAPTTPVVFSFVDFPRTLHPLPAAPANLSPPDSARSLANSVILLI